MRLKRLSTRGFRNLTDEVVDVDAPLVAWWGPNGQGKTNFLEAVGVLGSLRSFRTSRAAEMLAHGAVSAGVQAIAESEGCVRRFSWSQAAEGRRLEREERPVDAVRWLSSLRATWFVPQDVSLIRGEPALRRGLLDRTVLTVDPGYLTVARDFRRVVDQKSALLRQGGGSDAHLDVVDEQLSVLGAEVSARRSAVVERIRRVWARLYGAIAGVEASEVRVRSVLGEGDVGVLRSRYAQNLMEGRGSERLTGRHAPGPQKDDLDFRVDGRPARSMASQGQARSLILTWKLAELEVARGEHGEAPLFLMDDLGSELDPARTENLVLLLRTLGAQIFVTTTDRRFLPSGVGEGLLHHVAHGAVRAEG